MAKLNSGRSKKLPQSGITSDRYQFLGLEQAEPDLGDPLVGPSSIGAKPYPQSGNAYVLISFDNQSASEGNRYWVLSSGIPGLGLVPGAVTIRDEGNLVGAANSFTTLNFVGDGIGVDYVGPTIQQQTGIATIRVSPVAYGSTGEFQFKNSSGLLSGVSDFKYFTSTGNVGFGTTSASEKLHIVGNIKTNNLYARSDLGGSFILPVGEEIDNFSIIGRLRSGYANFGSADVVGDLSVTGKIYATNGRGNSGEVLTSQGSSGSVIWAPTTNVTVGSANSVLVKNTFISKNYSLTFTDQNNNDIGPIIVDSSHLVYNPANNFLGIGLSVPTATLHVGGSTIINGTLQVFSPATFSDTVTTPKLVVSGVTTSNGFNATTGNDYKINGTSVLTSTTLGSAVVNSSLTSVGTLGQLNVSGVSTFAGITTVTGNTLFAKQLNVSGISTLSTLSGTTATYDTGNFTTGNIVTGVVTTLTSTNATLTNINSSGISTLTTANVTNLTSQQLNVSGVSTFAGITTVTGNTLFARQLNVSGISTFTSTTDSSSPTNGALTVSGGLGVARNLFVGYGLSVSGVSTFSGITTVTGNTLFARQLNVSGISTTSSLNVTNESRFYGTVNIEKSVTEKVSTATTFLSYFPVSLDGSLSIDVSSSTVAVGILTTSVTSWEFTGVSTENSKATTITLIADSSSLITYGELCKVNGQTVSGGVRWPGGVAPIPTDNEDIISFAIVRDNSGSIRVYGSISLNFS